MNKAGSIRCRLAQIEVLPGRPHDNARHIAELARAAAADGMDIIVFPEMAIPGYLIGDEWEYASFLRECERCNELVRQASTGITVVFGSVAVDRSRKNEDGRVRKYNALFVAENGDFIGPRRGLYPFVIKTLAPNYREFDESRYFHDLRKLAQEERRPVEDFLEPVPSRLGLLGAFLCEDAWDEDYAVSPAAELLKRGAELLINCSSSPFTLGKNAKRMRVYSAHAARYGRPLVYVNNIGIQNNGKTVFTFDGSSCVYDALGRRVAACPAFEEAVLSVEIPQAQPAACESQLPVSKDGIESACAAILFGTERFMKLCGVSRVCVGISGGIDSSVVAALYRRILAPENLLVVNMPSRYNSPTTRTLARDLAERLGCLYAEIPIEDSARLTISQLDGLCCRSLDGRLQEKLSLSGLAKENIQARDRGARVLAAVASAFGGVFTCNGNKSEMTVGYATLYGDLGGYLANIADLWKMEVYELGRHLNSAVYDRPVIPEGCFTVTPSAELSDAQNVDEGKGDPIIYPYHDLMFRAWVESWDRIGAEEILEWYADGSLEKQLGYRGRIADILPTPAAFIADLERWWNLYQGMAVAKRIQAPPVLAVKRRAFGFDKRESIMKPRYTMRYRELKEKLLAG